jgi:hypothetical protein
MNNFGFPQSNNYAQSQVTSNQGYDTNYTPVENGGLFTRDECRNLARYSDFDLERSLRLMMEMEMEFARLLRLRSGWLIAIVP